MVESVSCRFVWHETDSAVGRSTESAEPQL